MNEIKCFQTYIAPIPGLSPGVSATHDECIYDTVSDPSERLYQFMMNVMRLLHPETPCASVDRAETPFCDSIPRVLDETIIQVAHDLNCYQNVTSMKETLLELIDLKANVWFPYIHYQMDTSCPSFDSEVIISGVFMAALLILFVLYFLRPHLCLK